MFPIFKKKNVIVAKPVILPVEETEEEKTNKIWEKTIADYNKKNPKKEEKVEEEMEVIIDETIKEYLVSIVNNIDDGANCFIQLGFITTFIEPSERKKYNQIALDLWNAKFDK